MSTMRTTDWTTNDWAGKERRQRAIGLAGVAVLHVLIAAAWLAGRPVPPAARNDVTRIQWLWLVQPAAPVRAPAPERKRPAAAPAAVHAAPARRDPVPAPAPTAKAATDPAAASIAAPVSAPEPDRETPRESARESADAVLARPALPDTDAPSLASRARQMAGGVDRQLRKEAHKPLPELVDTPYKRFLAELAAAHVPQWSGIATITEITVPGTGEHITKVSNGSYSYCVRLPSPSMGIDQYERMRRNPPTVSCPR